MSNFTEQTLEMIQHRLYLNYTTDQTLPSDIEMLLERAEEDLRHFSQTIRDMTYELEEKQDVIADLEKEVRGLEDELWDRDQGYHQMLEAYDDPK